MFDVFAPGETFVHEWVVPFPTYLLDYAEVTYYQNGEVFTKSVTEFDADGENATFDIEFGQEDSLKFTPKVMAQAQVNLIFTNGTRETSKLVSFYVGNQMRMEVINVSGESE